MPTIDETYDNGVARIRVGAPDKAAAVREPYNWVPVADAFGRSGRVANPRRLVRSVRRCHRRRRRQTLDHRRRQTGKGGAQARTEARLGEHLDEGLQCHDRGRSRMSDLGDEDQATVRIVQKSFARLSSSR
jgi:hypothetical protein